MRVTVSDYIYYLKVYTRFAPQKFMYVPSDVLYQSFKKNCEIWNFGEFALGPFDVYRGR